MENASWETCDVSGAASGQASCTAAGNVVDELADQMRVAYETGSY